MAQELFRKQNKTVIYGSKEYSLHFLIKGLLLKKLLEKGHKNVKVEYEIYEPLSNKRRIVDVVDVDTGILYEVEKRATKQYREELRVFADNLGCCATVIDISALPKSIVKAIEDLDKILGAYVD